MLCPVCGELSVSQASAYLATEMEVGQEKIDNIMKYIQKGARGYSELNLNMHREFTLVQITTRVYPTLCVI